MNNIKNKLTIFLSSVLMLIAYGNAAAKCNKEDINYYLEKDLLQSKLQHYAVKILVLVKKQRNLQIIQ